MLGGVDRARETLGRRLELEANARGWAFGKLRRDLAVMNQPFAAMLATKVFFALGAMIFIPLVLFLFGAIGLSAPGASPAIVTLAAMALAFFLPDLALRQEAEKRRRDFRHVVGSFLDLVAMNLAGGRGLPEALMAASTIGDHWAMARIRQALANARLIGITPWEAIGPPRARSSASRSCATWRPPWRWPVTRARRSAHRCWPGPRPCDARSWPTWRARRVSAPSRCWSRSC